MIFTWLSFSNGKILVVKASSCRSGVCGTCKKRKLEGEVKMEGYDPEVLEESDRQEGYILTCISYPVGRVVIDA
ncbi:MAG: 2Fe-2S iron-sulfur cluster binding domain-containing protein [Scytonema sp. RU_4_4]|nr:2Fe-2S iron-sulfur cluster binding domain-containing protein [Scytonema sp. RU_4_4]NJR73504.1 2Fe-2S iron-sulfur cluster binding domain-containing protein [Scytonema sp. CRU_2_7]